MTANGAGAKPQYPWKLMEVGDSFYVDKHPRDIAASASRSGKVHSRKFAVRPEGTGARIWRVA